MRLSSLVLTLFLSSFALAGFSTTGLHHETASDAYSTLATSATIESAVSISEDAAQTGVQCFGATELVARYLEVFDGALSILSNKCGLAPSGRSESGGTLHFCITAPRSSESFDPTLLRLDINLAVNGVDMGELSTVSGVPISNGRYGMVRIEGMNGHLVESFEPKPIVAIRTGGLPSYEDPALSFAQDSIGLLLLSAALLSALRNRKQFEQQQHLQQRLA